MKVTQFNYFARINFNYLNKKFKITVLPNFFLHYIKTDLFKLILIFFGTMSVSFYNFILSSFIYLTFEWSRVLFHEIGHAAGLIFICNSDWVEIELKGNGGGSTECKFYDKNILDVYLVFLYLTGPLFDLFFSLLLSLILLIIFSKIEVSIVIFIIAIYTMFVNMIPGFSEDSDGQHIFKIIKKWVVKYERKLQLFWRKNCD